MAIFWTGVAAASLAAAALAIFWLSRGMAAWRLNAATDAFAKREAARARRAPRS